jgi:hypothetical protein
MNWREWRKNLRKGSTAILAFATTGVLLGFGVAAAPAQAAAPSGCDPGHVCIYEDVDFNHGDHDSAAWGRIRVEELYDCHAVPIRDGMATSFYNNTKFAFDLWNTRGTGSQSLAGTMAPFKGYRYLTDEFNDKVDLVVSPGCLDA